MEHLKEFLELSTIHGLTQISRAKGFLSWFWIFIVFTCFVGSGVMIFYSFEAWYLSPVTTTIDTLSISKIKLPKVTVCPPKNTYTNLNYDIIKMENAAIDNATRQMILNFAFQTIDDAHHNEIMKNLSKLEEEDRYHNWYHGKSKLILPIFQRNTENPFLQNEIDTAALSGFISTPYFGEQYQVGRVEEGRVRKWIRVLVPKNFQGDPNITLHLSINWVPSSNLQSIRMDWKHIDDHSINISSPESIHDFEVHYKTLTENLVTFKMMPGFNFSWYYSGVEANNNPFEDTSEMRENKYFVRKDFSITYKLN